MGGRVGNAANVDRIPGVLERRGDPRIQVHPMTGLQIRM
jgi:hypothetical protein